MLRKVSDNANMKGSEPEWANQKQITSQVSYLQMLDIHVSCGSYTLEMLCSHSVRGFHSCTHVPGYTSCKGYITTYPVAGIP